MITNRLSLATELDASDTSYKTWDVATFNKDGVTIDEEPQGKGEMNISSEELEKVLMFALKLIRHQQRENISLEHDFYWTLWIDDLYKPEVRPEELSLGSLVDEWEFIESRMAHGDDNPYPLVWIGELIKAIGVTLNQERV